MKLTRVQFKKSWHVIRGTSRSEAAVMMIAAGESEGGPANRHSADQWLWVVSGSGAAIVNGQREVLTKNSLLLIEAGERHEIQNTGRTKLVTINFYSPPAY